MSYRGEERRLKRLGYTFKRAFTARRWYIVRRANGDIVGARRGKGQAVELAALEAARRAEEQVDGINDA